MDCHFFLQGISLEFEVITKAMQASGGLSSPRVSEHKSAFLKLPGSSELGLGERTVGSMLGARR